MEKAGSNLARLVFHQNPCKILAVLSIGYPRPSPATTHSATFLGLTQKLYWKSVISGVCVYGSRVAISIITFCFLYASTISSRSKKSARQPCRAMIMCFIPFQTGSGSYQTSIVGEAVMSGSSDKTISATGFFPSWTAMSR